MTLTGLDFLLPIEERLRINAFSGNVESLNVLCLLRGPVILTDNANSILS
jgi:hypothetical protein